MAKNKKTAPNTEQRKELELHYLKTNDYRSFHVDGVFGGITPKGNIYMELFLERAPTPKKIVYELNENGTLGKEVSHESKAGLIREIEAGIVLDLATAESINSWLKEKINILKSVSVKEGTT